MKRYEDMTHEEWMETYEREAGEEWKEVRDLFARIREEADRGTRTTGSDDALNAIDSIEPALADAKKKTLDKWNEMVKELYATANPDVKRTIGYYEVGEELERLNKEIAQGIAEDLGQEEKDWWRTIRIVNKHVGRNEPIRLEVNWGAIGSTDPKTAAVFAKWLGRASEMAERSWLNGVTETYS